MHSILSFHRFIPTTDKRKDFSKLEDTIKSFNCIQSEIAAAQFLALRGSMVSAFNGAILKEHKHSDFDIIISSRKPNRAVNQYEENVRLDDCEDRISVDFTNLNIKRLIQETDSFGKEGITSQNDLVMDFLPIHEKGIAMQFREKSLISFLRLGLNYYKEDYTHLTPSGAMKAINQARIMVNPLRWWSVHYSFSKSETADQNILHYYEDVRSALDTYLQKDTNLFSEDSYKIPQNFLLDTNPIKLKSKYYLDKLLGRIHSTPVFSSNDLQKVRLKTKSLFGGINKSDMDILFKPNY